MSIKVKSFLSLRFFFKWFELSFNFFAKIDYFIFGCLLKSSIEDSSLPKPKIIDHKAKNNNFMIVICRWFKLLDIYLWPLNNIVNNFSWIHFKICFWLSINNGLLQNSIVFSSLAKLFDWFQGLYLNLNLLRRCILIIMVWYYFLCFLKLM